MERIKYPKTLHLPWSLELGGDDRCLDNTDHFQGKEVVVTEKMDGENTSIYPDGLHPRSIHDDGHPSRDWLKGYAAGWRYQLPENMRVCGENLYAQHSIPYTQLPSYFMVFSIWREKTCLDWDSTVRWCNSLGIHTVPVLYKGPWDKDRIRDLFMNLDFEKQEGIVVRTLEGFHLDDFNNHIAKAVRRGHVQSEEHWKKNWKPNKLKG